MGSTYRLTRLPEKSIIVQSLGGVGYMCIMHVYSPTAMDVYLIRWPSSASFPQIFPIYVFVEI